MPDVALEPLRARLRELHSVVVAFSGGADSAFLAWVAHDTLGVDGALAVTAVSPSLPTAERDACGALAAGWGMPWQEVETHELDNPDYARNDLDRCYWCKDALMAAAGPVAEARRATVVLGVNVDDLNDHRPGQRAATERGAAFPLVDAGFTKADVRAWSRELGLVTWDKPAAACLASRLPYGTAVTPERLLQVEAAERALREIGIAGDLRVRHHGDLARVELAPDELEAWLAPARHAALHRAVSAGGFARVCLDLRGFRSGSLNVLGGVSDPANNA